MNIKQAVLRLKEICRDIATEWQFRPKMKEKLNLTFQERKRLRRMVAVKNVKCGYGPCDATALYYARYGGGLGTEGHLCDMHLVRLEATSIYKFLVPHKQMELLMNIEGMSCSRSLLEGLWIIWFVCGCNLWWRHEDGTVYFPQWCQKHRGVGTDNAFDIALRSLRAARLKSIRREVARGINWKAIQGMDGEQQNIVVALAMSDQMAPETPEIANARKAVSQLVISGSLQREHVTVGKVARRISLALGKTALELEKDGGKEGFVAHYDAMGKWAKHARDLGS